MYYQTTITSKGQITIPKELREFLKLKPSYRVFLEKRGGKVFIQPSEDFLEVADRISKTVKIKTDVLKAREYFEKNYERI